jgi:DNA-binding transcriptional LysR family regulator
MYGSNVRIAQLHYVRAVVDLGSLSKAAAALGLTQPALSNGLAALERALGGALFARGPRGALLTDFGRTVLPHIDAVLSAAVSLHDHAARVSGRGEAAVRVGISPLIPPSLVARAFEAARSCGAEGIVLREQNLTSLQSALQQNELDLLLVPGVGAVAGAQTRTLDSEALCYVGASAPDDGVAVPTDAPIELDDLMGHVQVLVADECGLTRIVRQLFADHGGQLEQYPGEAHSYRNLVEWARLGLGGAVLPASRFDAETIPGRPLLSAGFPITIDYQAEWKPRSSRSDAIESLVSAMASVKD